jgi:hypothetical protein
VGRWGQIAGQNRARDLVGRVLEDPFHMPNCTILPPRKLAGNRISLDLLELAGKSPAVPLFNLPLQYRTVSPQAIQKSTPMTALDFIDSFRGQLHSAQIDFALTSGQACVYYGIQQTTKDSDWIIRPSTEDELNAIMPPVELLLP